MNVILIGMPGSGKSTVGVVLAKLLGLHFCDTDLVLQQHCGKKLQEIIRTEGDAAFFRHEEEVLAALDVQNTVIATGGSAVYSDRAMQHLKAGGKCVWLALPFDVGHRAPHRRSIARPISCAILRCSSKAARRRDTTPSPCFLRYASSCLLFRRAGAV